MKILHHSIPLFIGSVWLIWWVFFHESSYTDYLPSTTHISLQIVNSYSWNLELNNTNDIVSSWNHIWTNQDTINIIISASTGSSYYIQWDGTTLSWENFSWSYSHTSTYNLSTGDGIKNIQALFMKDTEPYSSNTLSIIKDKTNPSIVNLLWPTENQITQDTIIMLQWSPSIDTGIGLSWYKIHIALDPSFASELVFISSWNSLLFSSQDLPQGTLFRYIEAEDYLRNKSISSASFFHHTTSSNIDTSYHSSVVWYAGWWGYLLSSTTSSWTIFHLWSWSNHHSWHTIAVKSWNQYQHLHWRDILINHLQWQKNVVWSQPSQSNKISVVYISSTIPIWWTTTNRLIKDTLLWNYYNLTPKEQLLALPPQNDDTEVMKTHASAHDSPDKLIYASLLTTYHTHLYPVWYSINYISWYIIIIFLIKSFYENSHYPLIIKKVFKYLTKK